jgi:hypothetical protein
MRPRRERHAPHGADPARSTPLAWYRWYPGDHLRVLRGWPLVARAAYHELLDAQWDLGVLPAQPARLREIIGATAAEWAIAWKYCATQFPRTGATRQNPALEALRATQVALVERCRRAGRTGSTVRWGARARVVPLHPEVDDA